jgi:hypothetical protein
MQNGAGRSQHSLFSATRAFSSDEDHKPSDALKAYFLCLCWHMFDYF